MRPRVVQALGYDVMLQCEVASFPTSAIDWSFRDFLIENEDRFRVTHFNTGPTSTRTTLKVCLMLIPVILDGIVKKNYKKKFSSRKISKENV